MSALPCPHCGQAVILVAAEADILNGDGALDRGLYDPLIAAALRGVGVGAAPTPHRTPATATARSRWRTAPGALGAVAGAAWWTEQYDEAHYETPARQPTVAGDVTVPLAQAVVSGGVAALCTGFLFGGLAVAWHWPWPAAVVPTVAAGLGVIARQWFNLLDDTRRLLRKSETFTREPPPATPAARPTRSSVNVMVTDLDRDPVRPGQPAAETTLAELPGSPEQLHRVAQAGLQRRLSLRELHALGLSDEYARDLQTAMLQAGYLRWGAGGPHDPRGPELSSKGRAVLRALL